MGLRKTNTDPDAVTGLTMSYRKSGNGVWYLEWRNSPHSLRPVVVRRARDTEIELIERIQALEQLLRNPDAPRPVASLRLKPFVYAKPKPPGDPLR